jgi:hypothetical protein
VALLLSPGWAAAVSFTLQDASGEANVTGATLSIKIAKNAHNSVEHACNCRMWGLVSM